MSDRERLTDIAPEDEADERTTSYADIDDLVAPGRDWIAANDGAHRALEIAPWEDGDIDDRGDHDDHMGAAIASLMRGPDSAQRAHRERGAGGGGESTGRAKPLKPIVGTASPSRVALHGELVREYRVHGLTEGEREFFHARTGEAARHLRELVTTILAEQWPKPIVAPGLKKAPSVKSAPTKTLHAYGLTETQTETLNAHPGAARERLAAVARKTQPDRVARADSRSRR